jgi:hypothetical protein
MKFYSDGNYKVTEKDIYIHDGEELNKLDHYIKKLSTRSGTKN